MATITLKHRKDPHVGSLPLYPRISGSLPTGKEKQGIDSRTQRSDEFDVQPPTLTGSKQMEVVMKLTRALCTLAACFLALVTVLEASVEQVSTEPTTISRRDLRSLSGDALYDTLCSACHGDLGRGNGPAAPNLDPPPADLTHLALDNGGKFSSAAVNTAISGSSRTTTAMPEWGSVFFQATHDPAEVRASLYRLTKHVRSLQVEPQP